VIALLDHHVGEDGIDGPGGFICLDGKRDRGCGCLACGRHYHSNTREGVKEKREKEEATRDFMEMEEELEGF
jgi:hypothetical protein